MTPAIHIAILAAVAGAPQGSCPVRVVPPNASGAWVSAAFALERTLHDSAAADRDCREVVVHAATDQEAGSASVEVTTADGRRGVRRLADARDLEPTVTALIVTLPADLMAGPPTLAATAAPSVAANPSWRLMLFAGGGARLTLPSAPSPVLDFMVGTLHRPWDLALYGSWTPTVIGTDPSARAGFTSSAELGVSAAHRTQLRSVDLILGGRATAIGLWGHSYDQTGDSTGDTADTRFVAAPAMSAFVGTSIPFFSGIRLRPQASFQWIALGIASSDSSIWSVGLGLGAESATP